MAIIVLAEKSRLVRYLKKQAQMSETVQSLLAIPFLVALFFCLKWGGELSSLVEDGIRARERAMNVLDPLTLQRWWKRPLVLLVWASSTTLLGTPVFLAYFWLWAKAK